MAFPPALTLTTTIHRAQNALARAAVLNPSLDARLLIAHALYLTRADLVTNPNRQLTEPETAAIDALIARRKNREPVARILGLREFWGLPFGLNEATLDPRPDSETLIETTLKSLRLGPWALSPNILDLGTGTGCLLLALLHELPEATGLGLDISPRAVQQATENADRLGLASRADFRTNNWLEGLTETFDIIISNPPYIKSADIPSLMPEVRNHDPSAALDGGADGLAAYRHLIPRLPDFLKPSGLVVFEIGQGQAKAVSALFRASGFTEITAHNDLAGIERCLTAVF